MRSERRGNGTGVRIVGGMMEVYDEIPWVSKDEEGKEYELLDKVFPFYWGYNEAGEWVQLQAPYGGYQPPYISISEIMAAYNETLQELNGTECWYCRIITRDGNEYYHPDHWFNIGLVIDAETARKGSIRIASQDRKAFYIFGEGDGLRAEDGCLYLTCHRDNIKIGDFCDDAWNWDNAAEVVLGEIWEAMERGEEWYCVPSCIPHRNPNAYEWDTTPPE